MNCDFFLITTFLLQTDKKNEHANIRCLGSREIFKLKREIPKYVVGMIEFESSYIPLVDIGAAFEIELLKIDNTKCILIVEHIYKSNKLYTGILIQDTKEIEKLAAGVFNLGIGLDSSINMHFILEMQNSYNEGHEILIESHRLLSLLDEPKKETSRENMNFLPGKSFNFINLLRKLNFLQRQIVLEELAKKTELWDKKSNVMCI